MKNIILALTISISAYSQSQISTGTYTGNVNVFNNQVKQTVIVKEKNQVSYKQEVNNQSCGGSFKYKSSFGNTFSFDLNEGMSNIACLPMQDILIITNSPDDMKLSATFTNPINNTKQNVSLNLKKTPQFVVIQDGSQLGHLLTELEKNIKWTAVEDDWKKLRDEWIKDTNESETPKQIAFAMRSLESYIKWDAVEERWKQRRPEWIKSCENATNYTAIAFLLQDLESHIKWTAVEEAWKARREKWVIDVKRAKN